MPDEINKQAGEPVPSDTLFPRPWKSQQAQALFQAAVEHSTLLTLKHERQHED